MAKKRSSSVKSRTIWLGVTGLLLLLAAFFLQRALTQLTYSDSLLKPLPKDSTVAGLARLDVLKTDTLTDLAKATGTQVDSATALKDFFARAGVSSDNIRAALEQKFSFAQAPGGSVAVFTIRSEKALAEVRGKLSGVSQTLPEQDVEGIKLSVASFGDPARTVFLAQNARRLVVGSTAVAAVGAIRETDGFSSVENLDTTVKRLPGAADGYLFYSTKNKTPGAIGVLPLIGIAWNDKKQTVDLHVASGQVSSVNTSIKRTSGNILPSSDVASYSLEFANLSQALALIEEQRQNIDVPSVVRFQNNLTALSRTLGKNVESDLISAVDSGVLYGRYIDASGSPQWMVSFGFRDAEAATKMEQELIPLMQQKLTVPVRKEIVRILPDGSQSREVASEGKQPLVFSDINVEGKAGKATTLPANVGAVYIVRDGRAILVGSSQEAVARLIQSAETRKSSSYSGAFALRAKLPGGAQLINNPDIFARWFYVLRPDTGRFSLDKASGVISGAFDYESAK